MKPQIEPIYPTIINKGWGFERILINRPEFCSKILHYNKNGSKSSGHLHLEKSELFICQPNSYFILSYKCDNGVTQTRNFNPGDMIFIPKGTFHQLECKQDNSEILEISTFDNPNDIVRIEPGDSQK